MYSSSDDGRKEIKLAFLPLPGMGHLVPALEFANRLLLLHNTQQTHLRFTATILTIPSVFPSPEISSYISAVEEDSDSALSFHHLPPFDMSLVTTPNPSTAHSISLLMDFQKPHVKSAIATLRTTTTPVAALIVDMFCTDIIDCVNELGVDCYVFFPSGASMLGLMMHMSTIAAGMPSPADKDISELAEDDSVNSIHLPGFSNALPLTAWPEPFLDTTKDARHLWLQHYGDRYREFKGIIVNSFLELQPRSIKALEEGLYLPGHRTPPVYPVGPLVSIKTTTDKKQQHECIQWLDGQPLKSVVFLCFGSLGSFSIEGANEIAAGLERSGHRFLWILRSNPSGHPGSSPMPTTDAVLDQVFPGGFLERTKGIGMVWPKFAPQTEILGHAAVGGFVTHCGWNSIIESLWFGVPMLTLPLQSEQHFNAFELVTEMKIAVGLKMDRMAGNSVTADEVERGVRRLMEEEEEEEGSCELTVEKAECLTMEMSRMAKSTVAEGGSSFLTMKRLTHAIIKASNA